MLALAKSAVIMASFLGVPVVSTIDGDTLKVTIPDVPDIFGKNLSIRIKGIDAPEIRATRLCEREAARKAKDRLAILIARQPVDLHHCERDKFYRLACNARTSSGTDVAQFMLEQGLAVPYANGTRINWKC